MARRKHNKKQIAFALVMFVILVALIIYDVHLVRQRLGY